MHGHQTTCVGIVELKEACTSCNPLPQGPGGIGAAPAVASTSTCAQCSRLSATTSRPSTESDCTHANCQLPAGLGALLQCSCPGVYTCTYTSHVRGGCGMTSPCYHPPTHPLGDTHTAAPAPAC